MMTPDDYYAHVLAAADADGRLALPDDLGWDILPFEPAGLTVTPLAPRVLPEPARSGEDGKPCWRCDAPDEGVIWSNERWVLTRMKEPPGVPFVALLQLREHLDIGELSEDLAAEMGRLMVRLERAVAALPGVGRVHLYRFGDGASHLHLWAMARPAGLMQLRGSNLALWDDLLPRLPEDAYAASCAAVADRM